ncbi:MAG: hypothetical protein JNL34_17515 [Anaerolineae bacterium]|nr:hypothetical protein [Anaerolineae bacterium]
MLRRLIGLLILLALIFPPVVVAAGVVIARDVTGRVESELELRLNNVRAELTDIEEEVEDVRARLASAVTPINNVISALDDLLEDADDLVTGGLTIPGVILTDFVLGIPGIGTFTIVIPNIPSTTLTIPGLSSLRSLFEDTLGEMSDTADAVSALLRLRFVPNQLSQAAADVRGLWDYLLGVGAAITPTVQIMLLACGVWLVVVYCLALYFGLRSGWRMLMGRT